MVMVEDLSLILKKLNLTISLSKPAVTQSFLLSGMEMSKQCVVVNFVIFGDLANALLC